jgi:formate dehydrogenase iron-sulfur subunit
VGGTTVITVLAHGDHPEWYGLPKDPQVPAGVRLWKNVLRPLGAIAIAASFFAMVGHYFSFGPKKPKDVTKIDDRGERGGGPA